MPKTLTKSDIEFNSAYLYQEDRLDLTVDPPVVQNLLLANVNYTITTNEGETIERKLLGFEIKGTARTRVVNLFAALKSVLVAQEDI